MERFCNQCRKVVKVLNEEPNLECSECGFGDVNFINDDCIVIDGRKAELLLDKKQYGIYKYFKNNGFTFGLKKDLCRYNIVTKEIVRSYKK